MADSSVIKLSLTEWTHDQRLAIARISAQVLTHSSLVLGEQWSCEWWQEIISYLQVTQSQLEQHVLAFNKALELLKGEKRDIRVEVMIDLLALALHITSNKTKQKKVDKRLVMLYDARARAFLIELEHALELYPGDLSSVEKSIAQQMYYHLLEQQQQQQQSNNVQQSMDNEAQKAIEATNRRQQAFRWIATGAGVIGGGAVIALTGGLAAPLLAPLLAGVTGAAFFATAGGVALMTSLLGLTGGGLAGWKMHRRMKGIEQLGFKQILQDPDLPPVPALHCSICISGFLLDSETEAISPWELAFEGKRNNTDLFCLEYETETLLKLGYSFKRFIKDTAINYAGMEVAKATILHSFFAAVALPATILKIADVIDNPWQMAVDRSKKAGAVLADVLQQRVQGNRPCNLIGYSCGCLVIWNCLQELYERGCHGLIDNVVMMGAPISTDESWEWQNALSVVSGRFINCYTSNDWVLAFVYRLHSLATNVAGLEAVPHSRIENIQVNLDGHTKYPYVIKDIMTQLRIE
ncbi:uncharacterized protein BX663DRAFT_545973 [Cokeromyces recurvatus]|uniref:uncharacterized protein n=1 Tax=Cokeromyces recurvatus TaxID=90255 RepID=UPI00221E97D1|nr:uncharacterized protein BX663DRAFT_545973 [Cokeromyces recurvatus]KAI7898976.1 hypothetical protein BX663DRAFT_545973 [Cokeromyces recurvatus]